MKGLIFSRGDLHPCLLVHAAPVKTSVKQAFVRKVCKNITRLQKDTQQHLLYTESTSSQFPSMTWGIYHNCCRHYPEYLP